MHTNIGAALKPNFMSSLFFVLYFFKYACSSMISPKKLFDYDCITMYNFVFAFNTIQCNKHIRTEIIRKKILWTILQGFYITQKLLAKPQGEKKKRSLQPPPPPALD